MAAKATQNNHGFAKVIALAACRTGQAVQNNRPSQDQADTEIRIAVQRLSEKDRTHERHTRDATAGPDGLGDPKRHRPHNLRHDEKGDALARISMPTPKARSTQCMLVFLCFRSLSVLTVRLRAQL